MRRSRRAHAHIVFAIFVCVTLISCARVPTPDVPTPEPSRRNTAPWSEPALAASAAAPIYGTVWRAADNRRSCALLAPARLAPEYSRNASARAATFSGGWGVAYDLPDLRSAFGVAGTGSSARARDLYDEWPHKRVFADSSRIGYGPEGGTGLNWLAYVRIPGQDCLYNVWSRLGQAHLEQLLGELRFVRTP